MNEAENRKELIDAKLKNAGWDVNNLAQVSQEFDIVVPLPKAFQSRELRMRAISQRLCSLWQGCKTTGGC